MAVKKFEREILAGEFCVEFEAGLQQIRREYLSRRCLESRRKLLELIKLNPHTGSHIMTAELHQVVTAFF